MKKLLLPLLLSLLVSVPAFGATVIIKVSQFPNTANPAGTDLFLLASGNTNKNITWNQLIAAIGTNPASITISTNLYVTNAYFNEFHGRVEYIENSYITNLNVNYITNNVSYITNLYSSNAYITNLFLVEQVTNYFLFTTNIYQSYPTYVNNEYVSNYFQTNVFQNTYMSNYFYSFDYIYYTNIYYYSTNLSVTNFYLTDNYVSNFFNTNIFFVDNSVSNFFATNIYNTINISSNYTYNYDMNLTNPVFYGSAWILPYEGFPYASLQITGGEGYSVYLNGDTGDVGLSGAVYASSFSLYEDTWAGPTNVIDMMTSDQYYRATSDCQITGFTNFTADPSYGWAGLLSITNANANNIVLRFPSSIIIPENTNAVVISNGCVGMLSLRWTHRTGTNGVFRLFPDGPSTNMVIVTNVTVSSPQFFATNAWAGPTNTLPLNLARQWYATYTPVSVTGYTGKSNTVTESVLLTITNAATTNVLLTLAAGTMTGNYTNQYTISNASTAKIWFEYDPGVGDTNAVFRQMK